VAEKSILEIIENEKQRAFWRRLNYSMYKQKGRSVRSVSVPIEGGGVIEYEDKRNVENAIFSGIQGSRFHLLRRLPFVRDDFGGNSVITLSHRQRRLSYLVLTSFLLTSIRRQKNCCRR